MTDTEPALIVHGGAGRIDESRTGTCAEACRHAARRGWQVLAEGGAVLDAAEAATVALEDAPGLNAGRGAVLNAAGEAELDASMMAGDDRRAGAVGALRRVRNPVRLARALPIATRCSTAGPFPDYRPGDRAKRAARAP